MTSTPDVDKCLGRLRSCLYKSCSEANRKWLDDCGEADSRRGMQPCRGIVSEIRYGVPPLCIPGPHSADNCMCGYDCRTAGAFGELVAEVNAFCQEVDEWCVDLEGVAPALLELAAALAPAAHADPGEDAYELLVRMAIDNIGGCVAVDLLASLR